MKDVTHDLCTIDVKEKVTIFFLNVGPVMPGVYLEHIATALTSSRGHMDMNTCGVSMKPGGRCSVGINTTVEENIPPIDASFNFQTERGKWKRRNRKAGTES